MYPTIADLFIIYLDIGLCPKEFISQTYMDHSLIRISIFVTFDACLILPAFLQLAKNKHKYKQEI